MLRDSAQDGVSVGLKDTDADVNAVLPPTALNRGTNSQIYHGLADEQQQQRLLRVLLWTKEAAGQRQSGTRMTTEAGRFKRTTVEFGFFGGGGVLDNFHFNKRQTNINTHFSPEYTRGRRLRL